MKFSNIACVALLGATLATSAYATVNNIELVKSDKTYSSSFVSLENYFKGLNQDLNKLHGSITTTSTLPDSVLSGTTNALPVNPATGTGVTIANKAFVNLIKDILTTATDVTFSAAQTITDTINGKDYSITLNPADSSQPGVKSVQITADGNSNTFLLNANKDGLLVGATDTAKQLLQNGLDSSIVSSLIKDIPAYVREHIIGSTAGNNSVTKALTAVSTLINNQTAFNINNYTFASTETGATTPNIDFLLNPKNNADMVQLLKSALVAEKITEANSHISDPDQTTFNTDLKKANEALAASGRTITLGSGTSAVTYNGTTSQLTKKALNDNKDSLNNAFIGTVTISQANTAFGSNVDKAQLALNTYVGILESKLLLNNLKGLVDGSTTDTVGKSIKDNNLAGDGKAVSTAKFNGYFGVASDKTVDFTKVTFAQIGKFGQAMSKVYNDLLAAQAMPHGSSATDAQKQAAKKAETAAVTEAINAGLQFNNGSGNSLTSAPTDNTLDTAVTNALKLFDSSYDGMHPTDETLAKLIATGNTSGNLGKFLYNYIRLANGYKIRYDAIGELDGKYSHDKEFSQATVALGTLPANEVATQVVLNATTAQVVSTVKNITSSTNEIASSLTTKSFDVLRNSDNLSTSTRLAMLSNPYNADLGLASAIDKLSTNKTTFASMDNSSLSSVIKEYTNRFENDANVWANVIGGKGIVKDGMNSSVFGGTAGYDKRLDNTILGGYLSYAKSRASAGLNSVNTDNIALGFYGRTFIDNNEIDYKASIGTGRSKTNRNFEYASDTLKLSSQEGKFSSTFANLGATYGYVIDMGNSMFVKPLVGLDYSYIKTGAFDETQTNSNLAEHFGSLKSSELSAKLGVELRKYLSTGNYFYITPAISTDLYKSKKDLLVNYIGSNENINVPIDNKKGTYFVLNTGLDLKVTDKVSTNISFGTKVGSKAQYYNGTFGIRYAF